MYAHSWHFKPMNAAVIPPGLRRVETAIMCLVFLMHACVQHLAPQREAWHNKPSVPSSVPSALRVLLLSLSRWAGGVGECLWHFQEGSSAA